MKNKASTVNQRVLELRDHMHKTQNEFAELVGLTPTQLSRIENGEGTPQKGTIRKIIDNTGVDEDWFIKGIGEIKIHNIVPKTQGNLYQDALYKELKADKETWMQKYNDLWKAFTAVLEKGNLGKHKALTLTGLLPKNNNHVRVRMN